MKKKKRGILSWVFEFAGKKRAYFGGNVVLAMLGVAASFVPYIIIAKIVEQLLAGNREWSFYLTQVLLMALFWLIRMTLHSFSTSLSHVATFTVLGGIRKLLCEKLSRIPLGSVLDDNSGSYKTIIMIAHRLKTVRGADQILVIDKGKIVQQGKHDDLAGQDGIYKNFITGRKQAVSWKLS